jgi:hypothetical protein
MPLSEPLQTISLAAHLAAREKVSAFGREKVLGEFRSVFHQGRRKVSLVCADSLIEHGIPPAFWHDHRSTITYSLEQRFDLFAYDVRWLRAAYPSHARVVRYNRIKAMLDGSEKEFWREAEYAFFAGRRPVWKLVASFSLDVRQQTDCWSLRSAPVARRLEAVMAKREKVFRALQNDLMGVRRTVTFTDDDAKALLLRRHQLWMCAHMSDGPTETAKRFLQMTGQTISRQLAAKHLLKIDDVLRRSEMSSHPKGRMR